MLQQAAEADESRSCSTALLCTWYAGLIALLTSVCLLVLLLAGTTGERLTLMMLPSLSMYTGQLPSSSSTLLTYSLSARKGKPATSSLSSQLMVPGAKLQEQSKHVGTARADTLSVLCCACPVVRVWCHLFHQVVHLFMHASAACAEVLSDADAAVLEASRSCSTQHMLRCTECHLRAHLSGLLMVETCATTL
jgi:hypothetical protein